MYCTPWCPDCRRAREYLKQQHITYTEVDISRDRAAAQRVREWANGKEITPTFQIRGQIIVNFDRAKLEEVLGAKRF
jgi:thioredoxin reductase (NADPH)